MGYPPLITIPVGGSHIASTPKVLRIPGTRSCFMVLLYDPVAQVGGVTNLRISAGNDSTPRHYAVVAVQRLLTEMRGQGVVKERVVAHFTVNERFSASALQTIEDLLRCQGIRDIRTHAVPETAYQVRFALRTGQVTIQREPRTAEAVTSHHDAIALGNRLLDLHAIQAVAVTQGSHAAARLLQQIAFNASQTLRGAPVFVALRQPSGELRIEADSHGLLKKAARHAGGQGLAAWAFAKGEPLLVLRAERDSECRAASGEAIGSLISVPLVHNGEAIGVLYAVEARNNAFSPDDLPLLQLLAHQAVIAVKNIQLYQELQSKAREMEAILQGIGDGLVVTDATLRVIVANPTARRLLSLPEDDPAGEPLPESLPLTPLLREASQAAGGAHEIELCRAGSEKKITCQVVISQITDERGDLRGMIAVLRDITAQREMDRLKSNLLSMVSHELRTPLHSISGFVDIILMGKTGEVTDLQRDFLSTVKVQSTQLQNIINDLLEFSRLECGQIKLTTATVNLHEIARNVVRKFELIAQEQRTALHNCVPEDLPTTEGDPVRLEQVLTNLVDNALKFTPAHGEITIGAADLDDELQMWVRDSGIGIPLAEQTKVFERFYQVANAASAARHGAGLGLSICKHIVERHHGRIWVESAPGQGSTFYVALPKVLPEAAAPEAHCSAGQDLIAPHEAATRVLSSPVMP